MKVVIIGGVAGGATAAARLRRLDESARIIMLERGDYISYANCGLPYYVGGEIPDEEDLTLQTPESFKSRFDVEIRVRHEAVAIHPDTKSVTVRRSDGETYEESYDKLILSPGAEPVKPNLPGVEDARIFTLRTIPDTLAIRSFIDTQHPRRAVIVGGGAIGLEMAENLAKAGLSVTIVEMTDHLVGPLDYDMACDIHHYAKNKGVALTLKNAVTAFVPRSDALEVTLKDGSLAADLVVLSVGVRPESRLAREAGLALNPRGAIRVDEHMQTSDPSIYALGDAIEITNFVTKQPGYIPLAGPANKQGRIAADHIAGMPSVYRGTQGTMILKFFDMTVAATGLNENAVREAGLDYEKVYTYSPSHATYYPGATSMSIKVLFEKKTARLLGAEIVGFSGVDKRIDVLATAIRGGLTAFDLTELELAYAPPFSSAKDPVNMAGYVMENILTGKVKQFYWQDVADLPLDSVTLLDVRTPGEIKKGSIVGAKFIPLDKLRERSGELDRTKPVYVHCQSGLRSYIACRILGQMGFECYNLAGGYRLYHSVVTDSAFDSTPCHSCGIGIK